FSLNPEKVAPLLRRLVTPTGNRARVYDEEGGLLFDTRTLPARPEIAKGEPQAAKPPTPSFIERAYTYLQERLLAPFDRRPS
ncbi:stimulus-sensing domain-containing protein, partial [Klebsiella aerogenes]